MAAQDSSDNIYDVVILGGGPAAAGAAVYSGRKFMQTLLVTYDFQGQSANSADIQNWIGDLSISGAELADKLQQHVRSQPHVTVAMDEKVQSVEKTAQEYLVHTDAGMHRGRTLIVALGARRRILDVPGELELQGMGVAYCSTCDAPLFEDEDVAVVGSGDSALESVIDLSHYARRIYLLTRGEVLKGDPVNRDKVMNMPDSQLKLLTRSHVHAIRGQGEVDGLTYFDERAEELKDLEVTGVFVAIGSVPNSEPVQGLVDMNQQGEIIVDHKTGLTSDPYVGAAGDVSDDPFKQNNIAVADGIRAALSLAARLQEMRKYSPCGEPEACD
jgi:alkyl hydroperoxide reductase subunit F